MQEVTKEQIAKALEWLGKARLGVAFVEAVSADLAEKAEAIIADAERRVAQLTPSDSEDASEAGGTKISTRQYRIQYIRDTLEKMLGYAGVWDDKKWTDGITDSQLEAVYDQMRLMRERNNLA